MSDLSQADIRKAIASGNARFPGTKTSKSASRNGSRRKQNGDPETELQINCHSWNLLQVTRHPIMEWIFHTPNGGKRSKAEAGKFKAMGVKSGVPDFLLPFSSGQWKGLAVELKADAGELSAKQKIWLQNAHGEGWLVGVARTLDEYIALVLSFLSGTPLQLVPGHKEIFR